MKHMIKLLFLLIFIFSINYFTFSKVKPLESFSLGETKAMISNYYNNKNYPTPLSMRYNQKTDEKNRITEFIEIYFNDYLNRSCIVLNTRDRKKFLKLVDKALQRVKSTDEKIDSEIGELPVGISWKKGNSEWIDTDNNKMFINVKTSVDKTHEMVISFSETAMENEKYKPGTLYLNEAGINGIINSLSDENYNSLLKEAKPKN